MYTLICELSQRFKVVLQRFPSTNTLAFFHYFNFIIRAVLKARMYLSSVITFLRFTITSSLKEIAKCKVALSLGEFVFDLKIRSIEYIRMTINLPFKFDWKLKSLVKINTNMRMGSLRISASAVVHKFIPLFVHDPKTLEMMDDKTLAQLSYYDAT